MSKRARKRYSAKKKATILATAAKENLTATEVQKRFGVKPVTYYSWRKKSPGAPATRSSRGRTSAGASLDSNLRQRVKERLRIVLPKIVSSEVDSYLASYFGGTSRRRRKKK